MYSIDITLKLSPIPISVQRKEEAAADALYQTIINAMRSPNPELLELTCEKQTVHADPNTCTQLKGIKWFKGSKHQIQSQTPKGQRKNIVPFQTPPGGTVMSPVYEP